MKTDLRQLLREQAIAGDGAMGTYLHQQGFPVGISYEEFNLTRPELIADVHRRYYEAGARLIETNTFSANRDKLAKYGLEQEAVAINRAAVSIARQAVGADAYVVGAVGSLSAGRRRALSKANVELTFREQIEALLEAGVDGIILETFFELEELRIALAVVRKRSDLPVICQFVAESSGMTRDGVPLADAFRLLHDEGADVLGFNCHSGPNGILSTLEKLALPPDRRPPLSVFANAGLAGYVDGRYTYSAEPEYFGKTAKDFAALGARIVGGCCGTTPDHVRAIAAALSDVRIAVDGTANGTADGPAAGKSAAPTAGESAGKAEIVRAPRTVEPREPAETTRPFGSVTADGTVGAGVAPEASAPKAAGPGRETDDPTLLDLVKERHTVIVELDTPRSLSIGHYMKGAAALKNAGADAVTLADNSLATARMCNLAVGTLVKQRLGMRTVLHVACRDRNMIGMQSHLMGLHALGIRHILALTGDPARFGDLPGASSVFDLNSFDLIRLTRQLNEGVSFSGRPMKEKARFVIGAALDPNVRNLDRAIKRAEKKIAAGADYFMTQPVYDVQTIERLYEATRHLPVPIFIGLMPLASGRNAEFLHHEVPGIRIPESIRNRMAGLEREEGRRMGVAIAKELLDAAMHFFNGIYIMTPMHFYEMSVELTKAVREKQFRAKKTGK